MQNCYLSTVYFPFFYFFSLELGGLIKFIRPFLKMVSKAKAAKLVRNLVDVFLDMEASTGMEVHVGCLVNWSTSLALKELILVDSTSTLLISQSRKEHLTQIQRLKENRLFAIFTVCLYMNYTFHFKPKSCYCYRCK